MRLNCYRLLAFITVVISITLLLSDIGCRKEAFTWHPEVILVVAPDSGLTTQTFEIRAELPNLPVSQKEFYIRWDLDGDSVWDQPFSADPTISKRFYLKGLHEIRAEILTEDGQHIFKTLAIPVAQGYSPPKAVFSVTPETGHFLQIYVFDASSTFDDEEPFTSLLFRWDFNDDGRWDTDFSSSPKATFLYKQPVIYTARLAVQDPTRRIGYSTREIAVTRNDPDIRPDFTWQPDQGTAKDTFALNAGITRHITDPDRIFTYQWDFRSEVVYGPFEDSVFPHRFRNSGEQEVILTVTDQYGLMNSISKSLYVFKENLPPIPRILVSTPYGNILTNFFLSAWGSLDDATSPSKLLVRWDFEGDGNWDTDWTDEKTLYHQFSNPGNYLVILEAMDEGKERATGKIRIMVSSATVPTGYLYDARNGKYYGTVKIGDQWWMSDNLDYRTNPKMDVPMLQKCYEEASGMCDSYGALYQSARAINFTEAGNQICPTGWRLPSRTDWEELGRQVPAVGARDALLVGGSTGFNARYTGMGHYIENRNPLGGVFYTFYYEGLYSEVRYLSTTTRPFHSEYQAQFYMGIVRQADAMDLRWGNINGYYYIRCLKEE